MRKTIKNSSVGQPFNPVLEISSAFHRLSTWRTPVAAAALSLVLGLSAMDAHALALGRVNVQSAIGEPLRAEIDVPDINAEEAASLKASIANPEAFKAAGLEYNPALGSATLSLQRRPDGRSFLRLTSDRPINEPFVDLILEANWSSGRIVRDYTMLFDPPNVRAQSAPAPITAPSVSSVTPSTAVAPRTAAPAPSIAQAAPSRAPAAPRPAPAPRAAAAPAAPAAPAKPGSVTVKAGNTATQLAVRYKPQGISLDQMLVAMLNANPDAFIEGNVNRLKKGAVLDMPTAATAGGTSEAEARQIISAQSKDFGDFRRRLAQGAPAAAAPSAGRKATGTVQANVEERKPAATAPDKLTLSKGAVAAAGTASAAKAGKEEAIAKEKQAKDAAARTAELSKNIQDLTKLDSTATAAKPTANAAPSGAASAAGAGIAVSSSATATAGTASKTVTAAAPAAAASAPASPVVAAATPTASVTAAATSTASTSTTATAVASVTPAPVEPPKPAPTVAKAPTPPVPEPGFVDGLLDNPVTLPAAGGLLALLAGFGLYRLRQRKNASQVDSSFLESRLQPDSFFGASGGQRVDTNDAASGNGAGSSSMVYSPSQLDAAGDVDPVAEADVYLAYGRDLQAEEILKEALRTNPSRIAVHSKLLEIYAKRRDAKAFETVAKEAFNVTKGQGSEWESACALGRELDPANPLYQPSGAGGGMAMAGMGLGLGAAAAAASAFGGTTIPQPVQAQMPADPNVDFDLDLDFSASDDLVQAPPAPDNSNYSTTSPIHVQSTSAIRAQQPVEQPVDLEFDALELPDMNLSSGDAVKLSAPDMASFASGLNFSPAPMATSAPTAPMAITAPAAAEPLNSLEFDLGDLSLDLKPSASASAASQAVEAGLSGDPLETKLALAQEFREIGDDDGARSLAQEVAAEATGELKARAQRMVADLS